jgi:hypothetical protein
MSFAELQPAVKDLPRADKLRLMQFLVVELAKEDGVPLLATGAEYPIFTPVNALEAGDTLMRLLEEHRAQR